MADTQHDTWVGVLFALLLVGILLGGLRILSLTGTRAHRRQLSAVRREGSALAWVRRHGARVPGPYQRAGHCRQATPGAWLLPLAWTRQPDAAVGGTELLLDGLGELLPLLHQRTVKRS
jgi:hypothetical protein